ncbi:MAG: diaminopimelate decarboxylase [Armatimonadota bacterium]|nr:MAG: diaminopimelate decarboxylase [Armatimonadota bacterium]
MLLGTQRINGNGALEIGGCDTVELARQFGTPLYVLDEDYFRETCRNYRAAFEARYPEVGISFSGKAFMTSAVCRIVGQEGLALDVSSGGELHTGLRAGFPPERILLHGSNKSRAELEMALEAGVGRVGLDHLREVDLLQELAAGRGQRVDVLLRVAPGVQADTHTHIQTWKADTKFGFAIVGGAEKEAVAKELGAPNLRLCGIHCHIGSQILDLEPFREAAEMMVDFAAELRDELGHTVAELDLGGGLGVRYLPEDDPPSLEEYAETVTGAVRGRCEKHGLPLPRLLQEPGRSLVGEAGMTLYTVGVVKELPGVRTYVSVDGGMSDNPRPALYGARYDAIVANKAGEPRERSVAVSGKHCETDTLIADLKAPQIEPGDILAVQTTGAYNYSMASNYNRLPRPAVVLVADGGADLIVERETLDDIVRLDRVPARLQGDWPSRSAAE